MCCYSGILIALTNAETLWHHTENKAQWETRLLITVSLLTEHTTDLPFVVIGGGFQWLHVFCQ